MLTTGMFVATFVCLFVLVLIFCYTQISAFQCFGSNCIFTIFICWNFLFYFSIFNMYVYVLVI